MAKTALCLFSLVTSVLTIGERYSLVGLPPVRRLTGSCGLVFTGRVMHPSSESALVSIGEAAARLGIARVTAYEQIRKGRFPLPVIRVGSLIKVNRDHLDRYLSGKAIE